MPISLFKIFTVFYIVSAWAAKALEDGKITLLEAAELGGQLGAALGIPTELTVPEPAALVEEVLVEEEKPTLESTGGVAEKLKEMATPTPTSEGEEES